MKRRDLLVGAGLLVFGSTTSPALARRARLGEDGLYQHDWYLESFLDLREDAETAAREGKRLVLLWGLRNCPACRRLHEVHLADPAIEAFVRERFAILHLNILGSRKVTDFDGSELAEKAFAARYDIQATPTFQFFPRQADGLGRKAVAEREVHRLRGLPDPEAFVAELRAAAEKV